MIILLFLLYLYIFLLGGISALDELQFDTGKRGHLSEQLQKSSQESTVPYIMGLAEYLANTMPIISSSLEFLFERFSKKTLSSPKVPIWQRKVQLVILLILIDTHLLTAHFRIQNL